MCSLSLQVLPPACTASCTVVDNITKHVWVGVGMAVGALVGAALLGGALGLVTVRLLTRRRRMGERRPLYDVIS